VDILHTDSLTHGYVTGLKGEDPDEKLAFSGSSYEKGYLLGCADREAGKRLPKYHGFSDEKTLPIQPGMTVTIPKGTQIRTTHPEGRIRVASRTYKVKVNHLLPGSCMWDNSNAFRSEIVPMTNPSVVWAGTGGYWMEVDMNDVPEAQ